MIRKDRLNMLAFLFIVGFLIACNSTLVVEDPPPTQPVADPPPTQPSDITPDDEVLTTNAAPQCDLNSVFIEPHLTADNGGLSTQADINCYAWQTFIALNWAADPNHRGQADPNVPASQFGAPNDHTLVAWQTYKASQDVFLPGAATPSGWEEGDVIPANCQSSMAEFEGDSPLHLLQMRSKSDDDEPLFEITEATGEILVDQNANLVYFEKRLNEDEFNYITQNKLYDGDVQFTVATKDGIDLPQGATSYGNDGAIEIKAAWRILDGLSANIQARYKQTMAVILDESSGDCSAPILMGLVGLHIIHHTPSMQQLMWATFEHVDNVPGGTNHGNGIPYSFFNPSCALPDPCDANATPMPTVTPPAVPTLLPVQVERTLSLQPDIKALNTAVQALIQEKAGQDSVWQYYQLVNVLWPKNSGANPAPGATRPINISTSQFTSSGSQAVSNVTMETYAQNRTCTACHQNAAIASSQQASCKPTLASDFSFLFNDADTPGHFRDSCP